jgi:hypothetical protein
MSDYEEMLRRARMVLPAFWPQMLPSVTEETIAFVAPIMVAFARLEIARARDEEEGGKK